LKALGTLVVVFERECLKVEWCAGRCSHKQAKKINCPQFCSSGYVVGLSWTLQCLSHEISSGPLFGWFCQGIPSGILTFWNTTIKTIKSAASCKQAIYITS
jgi:hypothetical protein